MNVRALLRRLQDVQLDGVIMTCKTCRQVATEPHGEPLMGTVAGAMTRQDGATLQTTHHVARPTGQGVPCAAHIIIRLHQHLIP
jgi:hypothetical protein